MEQPKFKHPEVPDGYEENKPDTKDREINEFYGKKDREKREEVIQEVAEIISLNTVYNWLNPLRMTGELKDNMTLAEVYKYMENRQARLQEMGNDKDAGVEDAGVVEIMIEKVNNRFPDESTKLADAIVGTKTRRAQLVKSLRKNKKYLPD